MPRKSSPTPLSLKNAELYENFKKALETNLNLSVKEFCRQEDADTSQFYHWLTRNGHTAVTIRNEVRRKLGLTEEAMLPKPGDRYPQLYKEFKDALSKDPNITLSTFCREHGIRVTPMHKWMLRNNLTVLDLKLEMGLATLPATKLGKPAVDHFKKHLEEYCLILKTNPYYSLRTHNNKEHINDHLFRRWIGALGLSERQLRQAALVHQSTLYTAKRVTLQFTPMSGKHAQTLKNVLVKFADGSAISMEKCGVLELCSLVVAYNDKCKTE